MSLIPADFPLESADALSFRKNIFEKYNPCFRAIYTACQDYSEAMGWVNIPLQMAPSIHSQASILLDLSRNAPFLSCVIGIAPAHSLRMEPHGDCQNPTDIASASLHFVLQPPCPRKMPTFYKDYMVTLEKFSLLQDTLPASPEITASHPVLQAGSDNLSFCHPLFVRRDQYPLVASVTSLPVPSTFWGHGIGLHQQETVNGPSAERCLYPINHQFQEAFMKVDKDLILQQPVIESETTMGSVAIEFVNDWMQDALVCVVFQLGVGGDGSLVALFQQVHLLTMLAI